MSDSVTPWTLARQAPLPMGFSRQEYWSGLLFPSPGDLSNTGIEPGSPALQAVSLLTKPPGKPNGSASSICFFLLSRSLSLHLSGVFQEILLEKIMNKVNVKVGMMFLSFTIVFSHQASGRLVVSWGPWPPTVLLLPDLHTGFSRGRSGGLVFPSLSEFSIVYCDPHSQRLWHSQQSRSRCFSGILLSRVYLYYPLIKLCYMKSSQ